MRRIFYSILFAICLSTAIIAQPPISDFQKAYSAQTQGRYQDAINSYTAHLAKYPKDSTALLNRGLAYQALQKNDLAIADFNKALEIKPLDDEIFFARGDLYSQMVIRDPKKYLPLADADLTRIIKVSPLDLRAYYSRGRAYMYAFDYAKALPDLTKCIELEPNLAKAYLLRGQVYSSLDKLEAARNDFLKYKQLQKNDTATADRWIEHIDNKKLKSANAAAKPARQVSNAAVQPTSPPSDADLQSTIIKLKQERASITVSNDPMLNFSYDVMRGGVDTKIAKAYFSGGKKLEGIDQCLGSASSIVDGSNKYLDHIKQKTNDAIARSNSKLSGLVTNYTETYVSLPYYEKALAVVSDCERSSNAAAGRDISNELTVTRSLVETIRQTLAISYLNAATMGNSLSGLMATYASSAQTASVFSTQSVDLSKIPASDDAGLIRLVTRSIEIAPSRDAYVLRAKIYRRIGNTSAADADAAKAAAISN